MSHCIPAVDDRRIVSANVHVIKHGLMWRDTPKVYKPQNTIYTRFIRRSKMSLFNRIFAELAREARKPDAIMIEATHLKAHRTAASLLKGDCSQTYRPHQGRTELQARYRLRWTWQADHPTAQRGPGAITRALPCCPPACHAPKVLLGDKGYNSDWFRAALQSQGIDACIPPKANRKV